MRLHLIFDFFKKYQVSIILVLILLISFLLMFFSAREDSITVDEKVHISSGYTHIWYGNYDFNVEHPPLLNDLAGIFTKLAKPNMVKEPISWYQQDQWKFADHFLYLSDNDVEKITLWARFPFIMITLGLIYLIFVWSKALFGPKAGLVAATLAAFSPNILAHGRLATTDIGLVFFFLLTCWCLRKYYYKQSWLNALILGLSIGLTILAKFSGLIIIVVVLLGLGYTWIFQKSKIKIVTSILIILGSIFVLNWLVYAFSMRSELNSELFLGPIYKFIEGLQMVRSHSATGHLAYLNGEVKSSGWWYYFPLTLWYKMTLAELILVGTSFILFLKKRRLRLRFFEEFLILLPPSLFLLISLFTKIDIGIRHVLIVLPFLFIFISRLTLVKKSLIKAILYFLVFIQIVIGISAYPNYIAYFNQIAGGSKGGIKHLADSNLDWNQNGKRFAIYAQKHGIKKVYQDCGNGHPFTYYGVEFAPLPSQPQEGVMVVCAQQLLMPLDGVDPSWLKKYPPDDIIGYGIYVWLFDKKNVP